MNFLKVGNRLINLDRVDLIHLNGKWPMAGGESEGRGVVVHLGESKYTRFEGSEAEAIREFFANRPGHPARTDVTELDIADTERLRVAVPLDRLVIDLNVSPNSPVVRGTWVTVDQVVKLIVEGHTWGDVLHIHPELTEADIRACLKWAVKTEEPSP